MSGVHWIEVAADREPHLIRLARECRSLLARQVAFAQKAGD
ncbi:hypothetical protein ALP91_101900 [Pseudomonas savastanoi pv. glycinea]|nr:Unknown protein sequence [Pseudomonas savastanoi pv. phaseolicola]RMR17288.1 hypothetical protein ALP91_101900 [Pseudomonas savastanoi pv. glycinea]